MHPTCMQLAYQANALQIYYKNSKKPLYEYIFKIIELSGVTSEERSDELVAPTLYAPDSPISGANLWKDFGKTYDFGNNLR